VSLPQLLSAFILFQSSNCAHLADRFSLARFSVESGPVSLEPRLIYLELALLALAWSMLSTDRVVEEGGGVLPCNGLARGLFQEILFFHFFYNFYRNGHTTSKTSFIPHRRYTHINCSLLFPIFNSNIFFHFYFATLWRVNLTKCLNGIIFSENVRKIKIN
jgi:hypothetical protein